MKKSFWKVMAVPGAILAALFVMSADVFAETVTNIVMTYQDKVYTKQIYDQEVEQIKAGADTDGIRDVEALLDQLTFQTNGEVSVEKAAVVSAVKSAIASGSTAVNIDLTKYEKGAQSAIPADMPAVTALPDTPAAGPSLAVSEGIDTKLSEASTKFRANEDRAQNIRNAA